MLLCVFFFFLAWEYSASCTTQSHYCFWWRLYIAFWLVVVVVAARPLPCSTQWWYWNTTPCSKFLGIQGLYLSIQKNATITKRLCGGCALVRNLPAAAHSQSHCCFWWRFVYSVLVGCCRRRRCCCGLKTLLYTQNDDENTTHRAPNFLVLYPRVTHLLLQISWYYIYIRGLFLSLSIHKMRRRQQTTVCVWWMLFFVIFFSPWCICDGPQLHSHQSHFFLWRL